MKRIPHVGYTTIFKKMLPKLLTWNAQDAMNTCNEDLRCKMSQQRMIELHESINLLRHAPILFEENCLKPMNRTSMDDTSWGTEIGFSVDPNAFLPVQKIPI